MTNRDSFPRGGLRGRLLRRLSPLLVIAGLVVVASLAARGPDHEADKGAAARELEVFKDWLQKKHAGYGCDEGPARFRNATVDTAYEGRRFYYVLTYPRGIPPAFRNAVSMVAFIDDTGGVQRLDLASLGTYGRGLRKVTRAADARRAAAAVLILALGDPGQRRWPIKQDLFRVKKGRGGWVCSYPHDPNHVSEVRFDRNGVLSALACNTPPVG